MIFKWKIEILLVVLIALICDNNVIGQNVVPIRKCCKENEVSMYLTSNNFISIIIMMH